MQIHICVEYICMCVCIIYVCMYMVVIRNSQVLLSLTCKVGDKRKTKASKCENCPDTQLRETLTRAYFGGQNNC